MTKITSVGNLLVLLSIICVVCSAASYIANEHQQFILAGVTTVLRTCDPATLSLLNEKAFPILTGEEGGITRAHVAGVEWGDGRIVTYSHSSFYINDLPGDKNSDNVKLLINSVNWCRKSAGMKIGVLGETQLENALMEHGFDVHVLSSGSFNNLTFLEQFDALVTTYVEGSPDMLRKYIQNGGGLLIGATGWNTKDGELESFWGNVILRDIGIFYLRFYAYGSEGCNYQCFDTSMERLTDTNAFQVWDDLKKLNWNEPIPRSKLNQMMGILSDRFRDCPKNETLNDEVDEEIHRVLPQIPIIIPTEVAPVTQENEKAYIIAHKHWIAICNFVGMAGNIPPHPAATIFPGSVSLENQIERLVPETIEIDGRTRWHSTGLYAPPGEEIKVEVLNAASSVSDLVVQIGVHSDDLEKKENWARCPYIVFRNRIKKCMTTIANPFGGPIYIESSTHRNMSLKFSIEGSIRSPTYFLGQTNLAQWRNEIRNYPAPWGELVGKNLIISAQASLLSQLNNPEEVINLWDNIMDAIADLAAISREREYPDRFVADVDIGGGYMHSGYPIMYYLESQTESINLTKIKEDPWILWGFLHEIGHNHQKNEWNFAGTGETTNNLFALYVLHTMFECPTNSTPSYSDASKTERLKTYVENGKQFSQWQSNNDLAFDTYVQLQEAFGWSAYKRIFSDYQALSEDERPTNDQEKIDLWMVMFSRVVNENLSDFFISWGFPILPEAVALVSYLPPTNLRIPTF